MRRISSATGNGCRPKPNDETRGLFTAKLLRDNPYQINIAQHNKTMMERGKVKTAAMKQAVEYMREHMPA